MLKKIIIVFLILVIILTAFFFLRKEDNTVIENEFYNLNDVITINGCDYKITDYNFNIKPKNFLDSIPEGYKMIGFNVDISNNTTKTIYISYNQFNCFVNNESYKNHYFEESPNDIGVLEFVDSGRRVSGWIYFIVPVDTQEVELEFHPNPLSDNSSLVKIKGNR